eukprot:449911-Pelagomonas_calceolata.AAC.2
MPTWQCEIIIRTVDRLKETHQRDSSDEATVPAQMPEVFTCEFTCHRPGFVTGYGIITELANAWACSL